MFFFLKTKRSSIQCSRKKIVLQCSRKIWFYSAAEKYGFTVPLCKNGKKKILVLRMLEIGINRSVAKEKYETGDAQNLMENSLQNLKQYAEMFAGKLKIIKTCLQIKSCVGHNLLKTSIALAVVLRE